jgi:hypothetical protein
MSIRNPRAGTGARAESVSGTGHIGSTTQRQIIKANVAMELRLEAWKFAARWAL